MSKLFVVRHGQASLFSDDYDRLSELGEQQARRLGEHWLKRGIVPDAVYSGSLQRQRRTAECVAQVFLDAGREMPALQVDEGLNEYPAEDIVRVLVPLFRQRDKAVRTLADAFEQAIEYDDRYRSLHRLLAEMVSRWIDGDYATDESLLPWSTFSRGVRDALRGIMRAAGSGKSVAVFTSGGPVGVSVQTVLGAPDQAAATLNWRVNNGSVTRYSFSGDRVSLDAFNDTAHLPADLLTYR